MNIAVVGLSHRTAPVEVREKLSISDDNIKASFDSLKENEQVIEVSILSTCNRLEIYALVKDQELGFSAINSKTWILSRVVETESNASSFETFELGF